MPVTADVNDNVLAAVSGVCLEGPFVLAILEAGRWPLVARIPLVQIIQI